MENEKNKFQFQIVGIELLSGEILPLTMELKEVMDFTFQVNIEHRLEENLKLFFVVVKVEVGDKENKRYGSITVSCIFKLNNIEEIIEVKENSRSVPPNISTLLNSISISTTRGVMFSTFKGTYLHNVVLPIVDPNAFISLSK
ncbi:MAG TPA: hypothetical protein VNB90_06455 [Cytophagaceae bacterium]|jgi:hypothetical protein|nr:hypothetical protein [Cytophagaceae bacterium]